MAKCHSSKSAKGVIFMKSLTGGAAGVRRVRRVLGRAEGRRVRVRVRRERAVAAALRRRPARRATTQSGHLYQ